MKNIKIRKNNNLLLLLLVFFLLGGNKSLTNYQKDFESFKAQIVDFNPQIPFRKAVTGYDVISEINKLQPLVDTCSSDISFAKIICKGILANIDLHCYIPDCDYVRGFSNMRVYDSTYLATLCEAGDLASGFMIRKFKTDLPIKYINGSYILVTDIEVDGKLFEKGLVLNKCNGIEIHEFVTKNIPKFYIACQWDFDRRRYYNEYLCRIPKISDIEKLVFEFDKKKTLLVINSTTEIEIKINRNFMSHKCVMELGNDVLYVKMPEMYDAEFYLSEISKYKLENYKGVIIDVRGNMGGEDIAWQKVWSALSKEKLDFPQTAYYNTSKALKNYYGMKGPKYDVEQLAKKYIDFTYIPQISNNNASAEPKLIIIQDRDVFSGTGNFLRAANVLRKATIIGQRSGYLLGFQSQPIVLHLKETKIPFVMPTAIDVYNIKEIEDVYHSYVDIKIETNLEYYKNLFSEETVEGKIFNDRFIKSAIDIINN